MEGYGYETSAFQTTAEKDSAKMRLHGTFDLIIAAGGDGTINEVVNGIAPLENVRRWPSYRLAPPMTMRVH